MRAKILSQLKPLKQFSVPFTGLKLGKHQFDFEIDESFFNAFEYSLIKNGSLKVSMELDKQETMMLLHFNINGAVSLDCDKCLSEFTLPVNIKEMQIVKFAEDELESDDPEIIMLNRNESAIDISGLLYEYINVSVPYIKNCEQGGGGQQCDQEMIDRLQKLSIDTQETEQSSDPRWEALKKLKK